MSEVCVVLFVFMLQHFKNINAVFSRNAFESLHTCTYSPLDPTERFQSNLIKL